MAKINFHGWMAPCLVGKITLKLISAEQHQTQLLVSWAKLGDNLLYKYVAKPSPIWAKEAIFPANQTINPFIQISTFQRS